MFHHGAPLQGMALLMVYGMCAFGVVVAAFGVWCLIVGIKGWFK